MKPANQPPTITQFIVFEDVVHYCVTNMPGSVPVTSTNALNRVTLPYIRKIAKHGLRDAFQR
ncbi:MAG: hypothetical protein ACJ0FQ_05720 [Gammaproteobacteria bacterium]